MKMLINGLWFDTSKQQPEPHGLSLELNTTTIETHAFFSERPVAWEKLRLAIQDVLEEAVKE